MYYKLIIDLGHLVVNAKKIMTSFNMCCIILLLTTHKVIYHRIISYSLGGIAMFHVGDKVIYPMHGAGLIESIEDREIFGMKKKCYIIKMVLEEIKVIIPIDDSEAIGIRSIGSWHDYQKVLGILSGPNIKMDDRWNKRFRENELKLKEGNICEIAKIVNYLANMNKLGKLSTGEKKMFGSAYQILVSELALINNLSYKDMEDAIDKLLNIC